MVLKRADRAGQDTRVVGYVNVRTQEIVCLEHGTRDMETPRSPWAAVRLCGQDHARYASTTPVICQECGVWMNDEATGYVIVFSQDGYWKRGLWRARGYGDASRSVSIPRMIS